MSRSHENAVSDMKTTETPRQFSNFRWLRSLFIILITLGIIFRFVNLDQKIYWADEAFTSLRISGYTLEEVAKEVYTNQVISVKDFQKYQHLNSNKSAGDTVEGLINEEPQLTPLYFVMVRFWAQWFGDSVTAIRSFSAVLGSLAIFAMYWLCFELFKSRLSAWIGASLVAVSPFYVLYSQEARPYSLLTLIVLLSSCLLLRLVRKATFLNWVLYSLTVAIGLYSHLFFVLAALGHGVYILLGERFHVGKTLIVYLLALASGSVTFIPWIAAIAANRQQVQAMTSWTSEKLSLFDLIKVWAGNISRLFVDFGFSSSLLPFNVSLALFFPVLVLLLLSVYAVYFIYRNASSKIWLFVFSLIGVTILLIWLPDVVSGERQSTAPRYSISLFLGIQLAFTYLLSTKLSDRDSEFTKVDPRLQTLAISSSSPRFKQHATPPRRNFWLLLMVILFSCGIFSCSLSAPAQVWWSKSSYTRHIPYAATLINQVKSPLVIIISTNDGDLMRVESLVRLLKSDTKLQFFNFDHALNKLDIDRNSFIYLPDSDSQKTIDQLRQKLEPIGKKELIPLLNTDDALFELNAKA